MLARQPARSAHRRGEHRAVRRLCGDLRAHRLGQLGVAASAQVKTRVGRGRSRRARGSVAPRPQRCAGRSGSWRKSATSCARRYHWKATEPDRTARATDNAAESLNASFKRETLQGARSWDSKREARLAVFDRAHRYNTQRRHPHLGQRSPIDYEDSLTPTPAAHDPCRITPCPASGSRAPRSRPWCLLCLRTPRRQPRPPRHIATTLHRRGCPLPAGGRRGNRGVLRCPVFRFRR
ncbi:integrase core domain-containing protein [Saccharothrix sp. Mg75]|uniref:integrase core domain-containing protein n=1 Tax=Saccharothrix sp. Mg75 TaxID=3445357 RepID=UPI003EEEBCC3